MRPQPGFCHILSLPVELLVQILTELDYKTVIRCCSVCRKFKAAIDGSVGLQYMIELGVDGMVDGPPSTVSPAERLTTLLNRRKAWATLHWTRMVSVPIPGDCQAYELVGGLFAKTAATDGLHGMARHFLGSWLPSRTSDWHNVEKNDLGIPTREFAIDPSQDLLALVESKRSPGDSQIRVHLRTISSNSPHSHASKHILTCEESLDAFDRDIGMQIVDDIIGIVNHGSGTSIMIWDWKKGTTLVNQNYLRRREFTFLDKGSYLLTYPEQHTIEIYAFDKTNQSDPSCRIAATLLLPRIRPNVSATLISVHSSPFQACCPSGQPFASSSEKQILVFSIVYITQNRHALRSFCVHNNTFLRYVKDIAPHVAVQWESWGPSNSRFFDNIGIFSWQRYVFGQRLICLSPMLTDDGDVQSTMRLLDFGVHPTHSAYRDDYETSGLNSVRSEIVDYQTVIPRDEIFMEDVATSLPYRCVKRPHTGIHHSLMIDEERIIGLRVSASINADMGQVDVYNF